MVTILLIALLILVAGLAVEIGIASWNIRRAGRYQRQRDAAESQVASMKDRVEHTSEKFRSLDKYATDISWLLRFLYNRYDKFADIDKEIEEGVNETAETPISEANKRFQDMKRAIKIVKVTVRASEKIEGFMGSIATQITSIIRDLEEADDEKESAEKKDEVKAPETTEAPASTEEPAKAEGQE